MCSGGQQYCLRWNNHRSNLLSVFDQLLQNESFTDVTLACEGGASIKGHKMVLAACSGYFAALFSELPCKHPVVVLKDVRYADMKAILEYMYRGEVNVEQEQLAALLKVAETLKVKGLVEENAGYVNNNSKEEPDRDRASSPASPQSISTSTSPPHSTFGKAGAYGHGHAPHLRLPLPLWHAAAQGGASPLAHQLPPPPPPPPPAQSQAPGQAPSTPLIYDTALPPHRRKLMSGLMLSRDTPILRTVLGQSQASQPPSGERSQQNADSSQATQLLCNPDSVDPRHPPRIHSNGSTQDSDKIGKHDSTFDDDASPYTDISMNDDESEKKIIMTPSSSPQSYAADLRGVSSYVTPHQKPEWKRYKQYTRQDILSAIEAVRTGMSANQASTMYGVPSRTLYDKVKKLGITKNRPVKRASSGGNGGGGGGSGGAAGTPSRAGSNGFVPPYVIAGDASLRRHYLSESEDSATAVEHWIDGNAAAAAAAVAVAAAQAAQAAAHARGRSLSPGVSGPSAPKYMRPADSNDDADEQDEVEDLSVSRKQSHSPPPAPPSQVPHAQPPTSPHPVQPPLASRVIVSMHAARQEEERERERELERERERDREREREMEREQEMGLREPPRVPIIVEDPRANPMEVGGERD